MGPRPAAILDPLWGHLKRALAGRSHSETQRALRAPPALFRVLAGTCYLVLFPGCVLRDTFLTRVDRQVLMFELANASGMSGVTCYQNGPCIRRTF